MCANCGFPVAPGHWTEVGMDETHDRLQARYRRAGMLRAVLRKHGLTAHDDATTPGITVSTLTGNHEVAHDLTAVWEVAEKLSGRPVDPLAPEFIGDGEETTAHGASG